MRRNTAFMLAPVLLSLSLAAAAFAFTAGTAAGQSPDGMKHPMSDPEMAKAMMQDAPMLHILHLAAEEAVFAHQMTMYALLIAVGADKQHNLARLDAARESFDHVRVGLRVGDPDLGLPETTQPEILAILTRLDGAWPRFDAVIRKILKSGDVQPDQVAALAKLTPELIGALDELVSAYEHHSYGGRGFSVLMTTIAVAEGQQRLIPKMATESLLSAYGYEIVRNKKELSKTRARFERTLRGLMKGDPELKVLPAPTAEIKQGYVEIRELWAEFKPLIQSAVDVGNDDRRAIEQVASNVLPMTERLREAFNKTVRLYHHL